MEELAQEVMAPRLHTASLAEARLPHSPPEAARYGRRKSLQALETLQEDPLVLTSRAYGSAASNVATGSFTAAVVR